MSLPDIKKANLDGKRILMRVDFNVEFENGKPKEKYKIQSAKKTIDFILSKKEVGLALLSHMGRPSGQTDEFSFAGACGELEKILGKEIVFAKNCVGEKVKNALENLKHGQILMLENVRFHKEDSVNDEGFARKLSENFDIYVNEAFGASHRRHSSIVKIVEILPSFAGFNLLKEVEELDKARENFQNPAVAIIGGIKVETKLPVIKFFSENYGWVLLGGKIGLEAQERDIVFKKNVILPLDYLGNGLDVGFDSVKLFADYISRAKTIVWNGPLGMFEDPRFAKGTECVLNAILQNKSAYKIAGGGETIQVLEKFGSVQEFDFISTGGGAMMDFLAKGTLPALEALQKSKIKSKISKMICCMI